MPTLMKSHYIGELTKKEKGKAVTLCGWVNSRRDHGGLIFIDLRDSTGIVQVVFDKSSKLKNQVYKLASSLRPEWVIQVKGKIETRPESMVNPKLATGEIEVKAEKLNILSKSKTLPFEIDKDGYEVKEDLRLKYRYLDLRRKRMSRNIKIRHQVKNFTRDFLAKKGFIEIDTPILSKSTPEGARDFLVPSRHHPEKFYALPQSPQQYKQLLMVAGVEKYFQFGHCFRDEDLRADRVLEFDQWDIEMSFVEQEDILNLTEELVTGIVEKVIKKKIQEKPFPRLTYQEAMTKYKTDDPDLRKDKKNPNILAFVWITDFPMFEKKEDGTLGAAHHPFTAPYDEDIYLLDKPEKLLEIRAKQYDLVLNSHEVFGGSIRNHDPKILVKVFQALGYSKQEVRKRFGHLLSAFEYGVPPHGGIAGGFARFLMASLGEKNIREVIPFPTTRKGTTSVMDAPSKVDPKQLKELHIKIDRGRK